MSRIFGIMVQIGAICSIILVALIGLAILTIAWMALAYRQEQRRELRKLQLQEAIRHDVNAALAHSHFGESGKHQAIR